MQKPENARSMFAGLAKMPKPDLSSLEKPDIGKLLRTLGDPPPPPPEKKTAGQAVGLDGNLLHHEGPKRRAFYDLATSKRAVSALGRLPGLDESFHCLMSGDYHGFDLVIAVRQLAREPIDELHVATLGFNRHNIDHLCQMLDAGDIGRVHLLCSDYFSSSSTDTFANARAELTRRGFRCVATRNHAKIILFAIGARRYVVESSANLRSCNNLEQFALTQSPGLHAFHAGWIDRVISANG